jgi:hypothetical protein
MKTKTVKITLEDYGSYLGMEKGCFTVKNREGNARAYIARAGNQASWDCNE